VKKRVVKIITGKMDLRVRDILVFSSYTILHTPSTAVRRLSDMYTICRRIYSRLWTNVYSHADMSINTQMSTTCKQLAFFKRRA
jgi:hypothetical protein